MIIHSNTPFVGVIFYWWSSVAITNLLTSFSAYLFCLIFVCFSLKNYDCFFQFMFTLHLIRCNVLDRYLATRRLFSVLVAIITATIVYFLIIIVSYNDDKRWISCIPPLPLSASQFLCNQCVFNIAKNCPYLSSFRTIFPLLPEFFQMLMNEVVSFVHQTFFILFIET